MTIATTPRAAGVSLVLLRFVVLFVAGPAAGRNPPLTTAELLVDLARDHGLTQAGRQTAADVQHVRALLEAAVRLDPRQADARLWLYELAALAGDDEEAQQHLAALLEVQPGHQTAFARWLASGLRAHETVERREAWLGALRSQPRTPAQEALIDVELARLALERLDRAAARKLLEQAQALEPASPEAALLAVEALDEDVAPPERLRVLLRLLEVLPLSIDAAWQVAAELDEQGLADEAARFFTYALELANQSGLGLAPPARLLLESAWNQAARGRFDVAIEQTRAAIAADPECAAQAGMFLHYLLMRRGMSSAAEDVRKQLARRFAAVAEPRDWPVNEVAQAAWFYVMVDPQPQRALMLAQSAADRAPRDPFVQRVLGWAQALNLRPEEARATLEPLVTDDPYAAYMVAQLAREAGDEAAARAAVGRLRRWPATGPALHLLDKFLYTPATRPATAPAPTESAPAGGSDLPEPPATRPATPHANAVRAVLASFNAEVLRFSQSPAEFLEARVTLDNRSLTPGEPWWATFTLANRGPFAITLGPDAMVNPVFLLSFALEGDRQRTYPALLTVGVDAVRVLYPGQSVSMRRTIDVGPLRQVIRQTPQQLQRVTLQAILDAQRGADGQWRPAPGGQTLRPEYFNRLPFSTGRESLAALFNALAGEGDAARVLALEIVAELLGEQQRAAYTKLAYTPSPVPVDRLRAALLDALGAEAWELRARALDGLQVAGLDRGLADAVERCLAHPHWLVRTMAVRLLARQGAAFADQAAQLARDDPDPTVRAIAQSHAASP